MFRTSLRGFIIMITGAVLLCSCKPTLTCDPSKGPLTAGCPNSEPVCDPSGICRQLCSGSACPSGQVCDSSGKPGLGKTNVNNICQDSCESSPCESINGNPHVCYTVTTPASSANDQASVVKMCKRKIEAPEGTVCSELNTPPTNWCLNPAFGCQPPNPANGTGGNILCLAQ